MMNLKRKRLEKLHNKIPVDEYDDAETMLEMEKLGMSLGWRLDRA
jgi:hypothetical protein